MRHRGFNPNIGVRHLSKQTDSASVAANDQLTTTAGNPIADNQNSLTAGPRGPLLLQDYQLIEKLAHQNRERIPERPVHAKGWGAYGTLTICGDISRYTKAKLLQPGASTPLVLRFSTVAGELGAANAERDVRGFAIKFYTDEGNWDLVGNNTPVFFVRDPYKFPNFIHTQKRHPKTNLRSPAAMWDFWSLSPESLHQVTILKVRFSCTTTPPRISFFQHRVDRCGCHWDRGRRRGQRLLGLPKVVSNFRWQCAINGPRRGDEPVYRRAEYLTAGRSEHPTGDYSSAGLAYVAY
jgi:hypothetical protein